MSCIYRWLCVQTCSWPCSWEALPLIRQLLKSESEVHLLNRDLHRDRPLLRLHNDQIMIISDIFQCGIDKPCLGYDLERQERGHDV